MARSTLHRWIKRYKEEGEQGLSDKSRRPKTPTNTKVTKETESIILDLREKKDGELQESQPIYSERELHYLQ
ncbi:helix-turn-helix domain-containing protein [Chryseobacterium sp. SG20098]|uniref:helix-turn-helix domain-containing protein n=1 Tax=Chryseobacterium sp. SG20098 TaxID=3074145 RepID=UPI0038FC51D5